MKRLAGLTILAGLILATPAAPVAAAAKCLLANQKGQPISGILSVKQAQDAAGRPETAIILTPAAPVCLDAFDADDRVDNAASIHVVGADDQIDRQLQGAIGKVVIVIGDPYAASTSHHHAPIVMDVSQLVVN